jgi:transcriptional regulator with XRE-family HTH domain
MTQSEFAKLLGITQQAIAKYEAGKSYRPSPYVALRIERVIGSITRDEMLYPELYATSTTQKSNNLTE